MTTPDATQNRCEFCDKRGLPLLLTRYAIAPDEAGAPHLAKNLATSHADGKAPALAGKAHYTLRTLRNGYLYTYDEARKRWEAYVVTEGGYYYRFPVEQTPPANSTTLTPCNVPGHREVASCITVSSPKQATIVWFAFSHVQWTPDVLARHADAGYRKRHMRAFDVRKWLAQTAHDHSLWISLLGLNVAEYSATTQASAFAFSPSSFPKHPCDPTGVVAACEQMNPGKGAVLALDDPAGIAMDLAALMSARYRAFREGPKRRWALATSTSILGLREAVAHQAELETLEAAKRLQSQYAADSGLWMLTKSGQKTYEQMGKVSADELDRSAAHAWNKYKTKYNEKAREDFQKSFDQALQSFDAQQIAPLAHAHAAWMKSVSLANYFECNYDERNLDSGEAYTATLILCLQDTQDKLACGTLYEEWMAGSLTDKKNLLLRGILLNQQQSAEVVEKGSKVSIDPRGLPWDGLISQAGGSLSNHLQSKPDLLAMLVGQVSGAVMKVLFKHAEVGALPPSIVALGVVSRTPVLRIEMSGKRADFVKYVMSELIRARGTPMSAHGLQAAVSRELELLEIRGEKLAGTRQKKFLVFADLEAIKGAPATGPKREIALALAKTLLNVDDLERLQLSGWRGVLANAKSGLKTTSKVAMPYLVAALAALAQWVAIGKLSEDDESAKKTGKGQDEARFRWMAGWVAFGGTIGEALGSVLEKMPLPKLRLGQGVMRLFPKVLQIAGKGAGLIAAAVGVWFDGKQSYEQFQKGNQGLALAYFFSAGLGVAGIGLVLLSSLFAASATGIGLILILLAMGISILIEFIKDNPVQEWLAGCYFGEKSFSSIEAEMSKLKAITE